MTSPPESSLPWLRDEWKNQAPQSSCKSGPSYKLIVVGHNIPPCAVPCYVHFFCSLSLIFGWNMFKRSHVLVLYCFLFALFNNNMFVLLLLFDALVNRVWCVVYLLCVCFDCMCVVACLWLHIYNFCYCYLLLGCFVFCLKMFIWISWLVCLVAFNVLCLFLFFASCLCVCFACFACLFACLLSCLFVCLFTCLFVFIFVIVLFCFVLN